MADQASRDQNFVTTLLATSSVDGISTVKLYADPLTHRLLVDKQNGGSGTVTNVSIVTANGFSGSVATATTTPAITLSTTVTGIIQGNGTSISAVTIGTGLSFTTGTLSATGGNPGGLNTQIQYNNVGSFGGITGATTNGTIVSLTNPLIGGSTITTSTVNGVTLTTGGSSTAFLNGAGSYTAAGSGTVSSGSLGQFAVYTGTGTTVGPSTGASFAASLSNGTLSLGTSTSPGTISLFNNSGTNSTSIQGNGSTATANTITLPGVTGTLATLAGTETFTNKRITRRFVTTTQSATPTINTDNTDISSITALAQAITSFTTNLTGTPSAGDYLQIQITDNGTARAITWGAKFASTTVTLPTTTVISTLLRVGFQWDTVAAVWQCIAVA